jgi:hypothetical protein
MSKKKFPGLSALAAGIAMSWNPAARAAAERQREDEHKQYRYKIASEAAGFEVKTEWAYIKAVAGAPAEVAQNENIHPYAWELVAPSWNSPTIDARKILQHYAEVFAGTPQIPVGIPTRGIPFGMDNPEVLRDAIRQVMAASLRTVTPNPADTEKIVRSAQIVARPCLCDYQDLQPLGECICVANRPYNPANDGNKAS